MIRAANLKIADLRGDHERMARGSRYCLREESKSEAETLSADGPGEVPTVRIETVSRALRTRHGPKRVLGPLFSSVRSVDFNYLLLS